MLDGSVCWEDDRQEAMRRSVWSKVVVESTWDFTRADACFPILSVRSVRSYPGLSRLLSLSKI